MRLVGAMAWEVAAAAVVAALAVVAAWAESHHHLTMRLVGAMAWEVAAAVVAAWVVVVVFHREHAGFDSCHLCHLSALLDFLDPQCLAQGHLCVLLDILDPQCLAPGALLRRLPHSLDPKCIIHLCVPNDPAVLLRLMNLCAPRD